MDQINITSEIFVGAVKYFSLERRDYSVANKTLTCIDSGECKGNALNPCCFLSDGYCREQPARV